MLNVGLCGKGLDQMNHIVFIYPCKKKKVFGGILEAACVLSVSICVQNNSFCKSAGGFIKSHLVTSLVSFVT